jgi:hypothetical protein
MSKITIVTLSQPCSACYITEGLVREMFNKFKKEFPFIDIEYIILDNLREVANIEGIEIEKFPAVLIDGEQVTAGSVPDKNQIIKFIHHKL